MLGDCGFSWACPVNSLTIVLTTVLEADIGRAGGCDGNVEQINVPLLVNYSETCNF